MYTLKYDKKIKEFRHRDSYLVRMKKERRAQRKFLVGKF